MNLKGITPIVTHRALVMSCGVRNIGHHWFRLCFDAYGEPSQYLNQCSFVISDTCMYLNEILMSQPRMPINWIWMYIKYLTFTSGYINWYAYCTFYELYCWMTFSWYFILTAVIYVWLNELIHWLYISFVLYHIDLAHPSNSALSLWMCSSCLGFI